MAADTTFIIAADHPALDGHFPGNPVVPGVIVLEQVQRALEERIGALRLTGLPQVKFLSPLRRPASSPSEALPPRTRTSIAAAAAGQSRAAPCNSRPMRATQVEPHWLGTAQRGSPALIRFIAWVALRVGRPVARAMLYPVVAYFAIFSVRPPRASRAYLARVLNHKPRVRDVFRHYHAFAATLLDRVYFLTGRHADLALNVHGAEPLLALHRSRRGAVLLGSHLGSFEALHAGGVSGPQLDIGMLMDNANAQKVMRILAALDPSLSDTVISLGAPDSLLRAKARIDAGGLVGVLGDRLRPGDRAVPCPFLGATMWFPEAPFVFAALTGAPIVLCFGLSRGDRRYDLHFELFRERIVLPRAGRREEVAALARDYASRLEHYTRMAPYNWFNFYDSWAVPGGGEARWPSAH
jgi:predicted LPLAT superfamily acyltransferase